MCFSTIAILQLIVQKTLHCTVYLLQCLLHTIQEGKPHVHTCQSLLFSDAAVTNSNKVLMVETRQPKRENDNAKISHGGKNMATLHTSVTSTCSSLVQYQLSYSFLLHASTTSTLISMHFGEVHLSFPKKNQMLL